VYCTGFFIALGIRIACTNFLTEQNPIPLPEIGVRVSLRRKPPFNVICFQKPMTLKYSTYVHICSVKETDLTFIVVTSCYIPGVGVHLCSVELTPFERPLFKGKF